MTFDMVTSLEKMVRIEHLIEKTKDAEVKSMLREELARLRQTVRETQNALRDKRGVI